MEKLILHYPTPPDTDFEPPEDPTWLYECDSYAEYKQYMLAHLAQKRKSMGGVSRPVATRSILIRDVIIDGHSGKLRLRIYCPDAEQHDRPGLLYIHGGGWFGGTIWGPEEFLKAVSDVCDAVVVSVDYALAPEHPFPAGLYDCRAAAHWFNANADALGVTGISVAGDSAGGNIAAGLCLLLRDEGARWLKNQFLLYPAVGFTEQWLTTPDQGDDEEECLPFAIRQNWPAKVIRDWYLGDMADCANPYVSPICAQSLSDLPPAVVVTCEYDGLQAQGAAYAERLSADGVPTRLWHFESTFHGFADDTGTDPQGLDLAHRLQPLL